MNHAVPFLVSRALRFVAVPTLALAANLAFAQQAVADADTHCLQAMTPLQHRLYGAAAQGPDTLRNFIFMRRGIYELDTLEVGAWVDKVNAARVACLRAEAEMPMVAARADVPADPR